MHSLPIFQKRLPNVPGLVFLIRCPSEEVSGGARFWTYSTQKCVFVGVWCVSRAIALTSIASERRGSGSFTATWNSRSRRKSKIKGFQHLERLGPLRNFRGRIEIDDTEAIAQGLLSRPFLSALCHGPKHMSSRLDDIFSSAFKWCGSREYSKFEMLLNL